MFIPVLVLIRKVSGPQIRLSYKTIGKNVEMEESKIIENLIPIYKKKINLIKDAQKKIIFICIGMFTVKL
jgi:hypothetical protein